MIKEKDHQGMEISICVQLGILGTRSDPTESKKAVLYMIYDRSVHVLYAVICIMSGCLCWVNSLSPRVTVTQLYVFNCRLECNICAWFIEK